MNMISRTPTHRQTPNPPIMLCGCKEPACTMTSATPNNLNRKFLKCRKMIQAVNCTCCRGVKGCFLWVWEDRLEEYVKKKIDWSRDQKIKTIVQDSANQIAIKDEEIRQIREELNNMIQALELNTYNFQR